MDAAMGKIELPYLQSFTDRHGHARHYYRRSGLRQRIDGEPGSAEFLDSYTRIHASFGARDPVKSDSGTFGHLVESYYAAPEFRQLGARTKEEYRRHIEAARTRWARIKLIGITRKVMIAWRDKMADRPVSANSAMRVLHTLFAWGIDRELLALNPAARIKPLRVESEGWAPWPKPALERFAREATGPVRLAFLLALYTGQRRADVLAMRWDSITDDAIFVRQAKTKSTGWIPLHAVLKAELDRARKTTKGLTIVQRRNGAPYTADGFGTIWTRAQHAHGIAGLPFHGLRKNATINLIEAGCSEDEAAAITMHRDMGMVRHYSKQRDQKHLAQSAMKKLGAVKGPKA